MVEIKTALINEILGRTDLQEADIICLADDWKAFCNDPEKYRNTVVVDMVNQYIDEELYEEVDDDYASNCHCDTYGICGGMSCPQYFSCHA